MEKNKNMNFKFPDLCKKNQWSFSSVITPHSEEDTTLQHRQEEVSTNLPIIPMRTSLMQYNYITRV